MAVAPAPKRRTILKGAAWSTPVIAAAIGAPAASASNDSGAAPNTGADFFWAASAAADFSTLSTLPGEQQLTYSTQISYRADPWRTPTGQFLLTISFNTPVTLQAVPANWIQTAPSTGSGPAATFMFQATATQGGHNISAKFTPGHPGEVAAISSMSLLNGGSTTWAQETAFATVVFAPLGRKTAAGTTTWTSDNDVASAVLEG